ncbi:MAG TPA: diaminopimelate decarboxylase [Bacillales bacterium]|nr:diaminopimelate decarboxylase [Bacillales bacterium]
MLNGTSVIRADGHLEIGGVDTVELARQFGTPLYVYDVAHMRRKAEEFKQAFQNSGVGGKVAYASKAFSCVAMVQLVEEEGLNLDVVSGGELYTALRAGFPPERIHFHGNNKSPDEIEMAVQAGIGCFIADNFDELQLLEETGRRYGRQISVLLRITPGVEAHTHQYIATGQEDSKFGFDLGSGQVHTALKSVLSSEVIECLGLHCHIGSQIFDSGGFQVAVKKIFHELEYRMKDLSYMPKVLNVGGGFGIRYVEGDTPQKISDYIDTISQAVQDESARLGVSAPEIWVEPGRAIVGNAGTTLYTVGSRKEVPGVRRYLAVDGGMTDNLRPALYDAKYEGLLANRGLEPSEQTVSIAGKCCESGDMLIWDLPLPKIKDNDILAVFSTGAYGYSMANNYNRIPRPAVVFVENGDARLVVKRETLEDLVQFDLPLKERIVP